MSAPCRLQRHQQMNFRSLHRSCPQTAWRVGTPGLPRARSQHRSTQRRIPQGRADEDRLVADMIELHVGMAGTVIAALQPCFVRPAGRSTTSVSSSYGDEKLKAPYKQQA